MSQAMCIKAVVINGEDCVHDGKQSFRLCRCVKMLDEATGRIEEASHICEREELVFIIRKGWKPTKDYSLDIKSRDLGDILPHGSKW